MTEKNRIEKIIKEVIIDILSSVIVEEMIKKKTRKPSLLVIVSSGLLGFDEMIESLMILKEKEYELTIVMTNQAVNLLSNDQKQLVKRITKVYEEADEINVLIEQTDALILPNLSINSAAKIATCISDTYLTFAASQFVLKNKPVIAATNNCCPKDQERIARDNAPLNEFYNNKMIENMEMLEKYGVQFTYARNINKKVVSLTTSPQLVNQNTSCTDKKILTQADIAEYSNNSVLNISRQCRLTDLAKETLRSRHIEVRVKA